MIHNEIQRFWSWGISRNDFVAEIGSGHDPHWRSDLLIDKFVGDSTERPGGSASLSRDRALVVGDAVRLPLKDKSVDFLIARNIVEHIPKVESFLTEMMRVSHRGYITCPSRLAEKVFGWNFHAWFVSSENECLILQAKDYPIFDSELSSVFHELFAKDRSFRKFYQRNQSLFVTEYLWRDSISFRVFASTSPVAAIKTSQAKVDFDLDRVKAALASTLPTGGIHQDAERLLRKVMSKHKLKSGLTIIDRLACPHCKATLVPHLNLTSLICSDCGISYPVVDGVPLLITEMADAA